MSAVLTEQSLFLKKITNPLPVLNIATFLQYQRFEMPILYLFYLHNGLTFSNFIFCQSMFNATCLLGKFFLSYIGDVFSKKYILIISYFFFLLRVLLWLNFSGFAIILVGEILYGLFKAFYQGNIDSYTYEWLKKTNNKDNMIKEYGKQTYYASLGSAMSCFTGVLLYKYFGFKTLLFVEVFTQIFALASLFLLPNHKTPVKRRLRAAYYIKLTFKHLKSVFNNKKINYYVYYSACLNGLTSIFVWNFQPLLKLSGAPIFSYGAINFINQLLRGLGGLWAKNCLRWKNDKLIKLAYLSVIVSFILLIAGYIVANCIITSIILILICLAILLFVVFNIFTVSRIHKNTYSFKRAAISSTNTFLTDFASFFLLLSFKFLYDALGVMNTIIIFAVVSIIVLFPKFKRVFE